MAENISLGTRMSFPLSKKVSPRTAAPPMETAIEMLKAKHSSIVMSRVRDMAGLGGGAFGVYWAISSSCERGSR